jgi:hypothetical protein
MGQGIGSVPQFNEEQGSVEELGSSKLVVTHVEVKKQRVEVKVPVLVEESVPTTKYIVRTEETVCYKPRTEETVRYEETVRPTTRYEEHVEETVRYEPRVVECEKPVVVDKLYERPIIQEKTYQLVSFTDLEAIKEAMALLPKLLAEVRELRKVKIVEEVIKVPKIEYVPTSVYKITQSGELVKDAN